MTILKVKSFKNYKSISIRIEMNKWNQWDLNPSIKWDQLLFNIKECISPILQNFIN
jgi:hypothetical protein